MASKSWHTIKIRFCEYVDQEVALQSELVHPPEWLPYQMPRVVAHRCSQALVCNLDDRPSCTWAGSNPIVDPFLAS